MHVASALSTNRHNHHHYQASNTSPAQGESERNREDSYLIPTSSSTGMSDSNNKASTSTSTTEKSQSSTVKSNTAGKEETNKPAVVVTPQDDSTPPAAAEPRRTTGTSDTHKQPVVVGGYPVMYPIGVEPPSPAGVTPLYGGPTAVEGGGMYSLPSAPSYARVARTGVAPPEPPSPQDSHHQQHAGVPHHHHHPPASPLFMSRGGGGGNMAPPLSPGPPYLSPVLGGMYPVGYATTSGLPHQQSTGSSSEEGNHHSSSNNAWSDSRAGQYSPQISAQGIPIPYVPGMPPRSNRSSSFDEMLPPVDPAAYSPYTPTTTATSSSPIYSQQQQGSWGYPPPPDMYGGASPSLQPRPGTLLTAYPPPPIPRMTYGGGGGGGGGGAGGQYYPATSPGPPIQTTASNKGPDGANLFIFHIPNHFTNVDMFNLFCPYGNLLSVRIMVEKESGRSRGFGFVSYDNPESAALAIKELNGFAIGNKRLKVQHKQIRASEQQGHYDRGGYGDYGRGMPPYGGGGGGGGGPYMMPPQQQQWYGNEPAYGPGPPQQQQQQQQPGGDPSMEGPAESLEAPAEGKKSNEHTPSATPPTSTGLTNLDDLRQALPEGE